ncbi:hypothetical protein [Cupriavidus necator]|uniref:hypothetical protein n=1 Tax=Cupriavidus necator TaxID=106590 RepID=UPI0039C1320B
MKRNRCAPAHAIEAEVVRAGLAELALPEILVEIAEQMRALWQTAVAAQLAAGDDSARYRAFPAECFNVVTI